MTEEPEFQGNLEIEQALKEFEVKSSAEAIQQAPEISKTSDVPKMVQLVMKYSGGAIKEQRQAEYVLLGFAAVIFLISLYLFFGVGSKAQKFTPEMTEQMKQMP